MGDNGEGVITELNYKGRVFKIVVSADGGTVIEFVNTSGLTDTTLMAVVGAPTMQLIHNAKLMGMFQLTLQLLAVVMVDAAELNSPD